MKVYLASAVNWERDRTPLPAFERIAALDRFQVHTLTDDPSAADLILFVDAHLHPNDWQLRSIRQHPLAVRYPEKVCIYDERDRPWCSLPGIYVSMPHSVFDSKSQRAYGYYTNNMTQRLHGADKIVPDLLFSFMGARTHKIRERILRLSHPRAEITDTSSVNFFIPSGEADYADKIEKQKQQFAMTLLRSQFVICPRGAGTSSIRLYETMAAGRVPVIVSDDWQKPSGPEWDAFAVFVQEADIEKIPSILEAREQEYETMSGNALAAYTQWFSPDVMYHHLIENCQAILKSPRQPKSIYNRRYFQCDWEDASIRGRMTLVRLRNHLLRRGRA